MSRTQTIKHKSGDHFEFQATYTDELENPISLASVDIKSQIRLPDGTLVTEMKVTKKDQITYPGEFSLVAPKTSHWEANKLMIWDIQYSHGGKITSTETLNIQVLPDVTR
jgi:hypothetical protein